jgi:SRSO17 transposase
MLKILRIPRGCRDFFTPAQNLFSRRQWRYFRDLVLAIGIAFGRRNVTNLKRYLPRGPHRTNYNAFLIEWNWKPRQALQALARARLQKMRLRPGETIYVIVDDTKQPKRGQQMAAVGKLKDPVTGASLRGHNYVVLLLVVRGQIIPFGIELYAKKDFCESHPEVAFWTQLQLAQHMIQDLPEFKGQEVCVVLDSYYASKALLNAIRAKGFEFVTTVKSNRNLYLGQEKKKAGPYAQNINRRDAEKVTLGGGCKRKTYRVGRRIVSLPGVGLVGLIASRFPREKKVVAILASHLQWTAKRILEAHRMRWSIELFFKETKQLLGLGDYQNLPYESVVKHLHLVCTAYLLLTHTGHATCAQGYAKDKRLCVSPRINELQAHLRRIVLNDLVNVVEEKVTKPEAFNRLLKLLSMDSV